MKYYLANRFIYILGVWCAILFFCMFSSNAYLNEFIIIFGLMLVMLAFIYLQDECKLNANERLFLHKLSKI